MRFESRLIRENLPGVEVIRRAIESTNVNNLDSVVLMRDAGFLGSAVEICLVDTTPTGAKNIKIGPIFSVHALQSTAAMKQHLPGILNFITAP